MMYVVFLSSYIRFDINLLKFNLPIVILTINYLMGNDWKLIFPIYHMFEKGKINDGCYYSLLRNFSQRFFFWSYAKNQNLEGNKYQLYDIENWFRTV